MTEDNEAQFFVDMAKASNRVLGMLVNAKVTIVGLAFNEVVKRSPVKTGAYRANHFVSTLGGEILYESPNSPGPVQIIAPASPLEPPNARDARESVRDTKLESILVGNDRFYALQLENGSSAQAPLGIYAVSADAMDAFPLNIDGVRIA